MRGFHRYRLLVSAGTSLIVTLLLLITPVSIPLTDDFRTPATGTAPSPPLTQGTEIVQRFPGREAPIESVSLQFATYKRTNKGTVRVQLQALRGGQWQTVDAWTVEKEQLQDNAFHAFRFAQPLILPAQEQLALVVAADGDPSQAISWWYDPGLGLPGYQMLVNGTPQPGTAVFAIHHVREAGSLFSLLPRFWSRLTLFLNPGWQIVLAFSIIVALCAPGLVVAAFMKQRDIG